MSRTTLCRMWLYAERNELRYRTTLCIGCVVLGRRCVKDGGVGRKALHSKSSLHGEIYSKSSEYSHNRRSQAINDGMPMVVCCSDCGVGSISCGN